MCNLNFIVQKKKGNIELVSLVNTMTNISYETNSDGDGTYFDSENLLVKSDKKINLLRYSKQIKGSKFILSHQRLATHGRTKRYTQPFKSKRFIFLHNGIMSKFSNGVYSDSYGFFRKFIKTFNRLNNVPKSVKKLLDGDYKGSYSILIFDKKEKELFYFKNSGTNIHIHISNDNKFLFGTTSYTNGNILKILYPNTKFRKLKVKNNTIYKIFIDERVNFKATGKIKTKKINYSFSGWTESEVQKNNINPKITKINKGKNDISAQIGDFVIKTEESETDEKVNFCEFCGKSIVDDDFVIDMQGVTLCNDCIRQNDFLVMDKPKYNTT